MRVYESRNKRPQAKHHPLADIPCANFFFLFVCLFVCLCFFLFCRICGICYSGLYNDVKKVVRAKMHFKLTADQAANQERLKQGMRRQTERRRKRDGGVCVCVEGCVCVCVERL